VHDTSSQAVWAPLFRDIERSIEPLFGMFGMDCSRSHAPQRLRGARERGSSPWRLRASTSIPPDSTGTPVPQAS
jgi:hypothetical protein